MRALSPGPGRLPRLAPSLADFFRNPGCDDTYISRDGRYTAWYAGSSGRVRSTVDRGEDRDDLVYHVVWRREPASGWRKTLEKRHEGKGFFVKAHRVELYAAFLVRNVPAASTAADLRSATR